MDPEGAAAARRTVLLVDDDDALAELVREALADEGFAVSVLDRVAPDAILEAAVRVAPACVLLDGDAPGDYGASWDAAAGLPRAAPAVPVVMFTADAAAVREATDNRSPRSRAAGFAAVLPKPFDVDELIETVSQVTAHAPPRD
jgi:two-component system, NtrC family, nitrogen regulation response regulator GlnG